MIEVEAGGLLDLIRQLSRVEGDIDEAAMLAVNTAARDGRVLGAEQIGEEINYPKGYLNKDRLSVSKRATKRDPEAIIRGRDRSTMLARFATTKPRFGRQKGVTVRVNPAREVVLDRGFFMKLRNNNIGLAVRLAPGQRLRNSTAAKDLGNGVYLLYGPSVNQAFQGVAADIAPNVTSIARNEFLRQYRRLHNGG